MADWWLHDLEMMSLRQLINNERSELERWESEKMVKELTITPV